MKRLTIQTQGVKGGDSKTTEKGYLMVCADGDKILSVDNYKGFGETYTTLETPIICIFGENKNVIFEGTHKQLIAMLSVNETVAETEIVNRNVFFAELATRVKFVDSETLNEIIETHLPLGYFYSVNNGIYVSVDNHSGDAWTEDHETKEDMLTWLFDYDNVSDERKYGK